ncbi:hypothetical protein BC938DRAFT_478251 [Jimgerdemannia flammicorona]|uniref:Uncharacterized protein n=1 Tax=Jimgerdemannia flammicorona TaxID=994334 RepID=A0A433P609_9FUNG|nr:hypothetical protein BC938DRAFT_478251 [Jimgerdemannia flammicorona]
MSLLLIVHDLHYLYREATTRVTTSRTTHW